MIKRSTRANDTTTNHDHTIDIKAASTEIIHISVDTGSISSETVASSSDTVSISS